MRLRRVVATIVLGILGGEARAADAPPLIPGSKPDVSAVCKLNGNIVQGCNIFCALAFKKLHGNLQASPANQPPDFDQGGFEVQNASRVEISNGGREGRRDQRGWIAIEQGDLKFVHLFYMSSNMFCQMALSPPPGTAHSWEIVKFEQ